MKRYVHIALLSLLAIELGFGQAQYNPDKPPPFFKGDKKKDDPNIRTLQGVVKGTEDNALDGAVVKIKNIKTLQIRSFITKADGQYSFGGLSTNADYEVWADYQGGSSETRTLSVFDSRKAAVINLKVEPKKKEEK